ncbi:MAG: hypothetical protein OEM00_02125 [Burkholderiaceae bacterium]|nr:hypothetical protein [Burkholderiaceae bacterium]MDH3459773.1 hypothetical protein [Burkholderiaceae bacterium]
MNRLPEHPTSGSSEPWRRHEPHAAYVPPPPKTWIGKLIVGVVGAVVILASLLVSIVVFALVASLLLAGVIYFIWTVRRAQRKVQRQTIDMP